MGGPLSARSGSAARAPGTPASRGSPVITPTTPLGSVGEGAFGLDGGRSGGAKSDSDDSGVSSESSGTRRRRLRKQQGGGQEAAGGARAAAAAAAPAPAPAPPPATAAPPRQQPPQAPPQQAAPVMQQQQQVQVPPPPATRPPAAPPALPPAAGPSGGGGVGPAGSPEAQVRNAGVAGQTGPTRSQAAPAASGGGGGGGADSQAAAKAADSSSGSDAAALASLLQVRAPRSCSSINALGRPSPPLPPHIAARVAHLGAAVAPPHHPATRLRHRVVARAAARRRGRGRGRQRRRPCDPCCPAPCVGTRHSLARRRPRSPARRARWPALQQQQRRQGLLVVVLCVCRVAAACDARLSLVARGVGGARRAGPCVRGAARRVCRAASLAAGGPPAQARTRRAARLARKGSRPLQWRHLVLGPLARSGQSKCQQSVLSRK